MIDADILISLAAEAGDALTSADARRLDLYARLLVEWNEKMNLTAITAPEDILVKHFVDSLTVLPHLPAGPCALIDVGTGAGFPGVPLAVVRKDIRLTLLDSLNKRLVFLKALCEALEVPAALIHARAEEAGRQTALRERFDVSTARAVAGLPTLCEYCLPFVKPGGRFIAMKGPEADAEVQAAQKAVALLGGRTAQVEALQLPPHPLPGQEAMERRLILIDKINPTPPLYPRPSAKIAKLPL